MGKEYKKPSDKEIREKLNDIQYKVTQQQGTERPFHNEYWNEVRQGIYVDIVTGEPLFSSVDKYKSGTGWPSFTKPLVSQNIVEKEDRSLFSVRTEVLSKHGQSHLGHVFNDGPQPTGLRYCINSAALRFIPIENLEKEGYGEFAKAFKNKNAAKTATFGGGCFWCMEPPFDALNGVLKTEVGYMGGKLDNPTYEQVSKGGTGHAEVIQITYDPDLVSYEGILDVFWKNIDPFDPHGQFCDKGDQYRSAVFYQDAREKELAEKSIKEVEEKLKQKVATTLEPSAKFYIAEEYHQNYYQNNPIRYKFYRRNCGRDKRLEQVWKGFDK